MHVFDSELRARIPNVFIVCGIHYMFNVFNGAKTKEEKEEVDVSKIL